MDVRELLRQMSESLGLQLKAAGMAMHLELPPHPLTVLLDRTGMQEAFTQIIQLACRVMPAGSTLKLLARVDGTQAVVNFMDAVPADSEPRLGQCFEAASARNFGAADGDPAGLIEGVALCGRIVSQHQGRIYASPSPLGSLGITLRLPLCQA
jgi:two-component system sensor histidine kinase BaeS